MTPEILARQEAITRLSENGGAAPAAPRQAVRDTADDLHAIFHGLPRED